MIQLQDIEKSINSIFKSDVISLKCFNGVRIKTSSQSNSNTPNYAQNLIDSLEREEKLKKSFKEKKDER